MRLKLYFELENSSISMQYRKFILSYFKNALMKNDKKYFDRFYEEKNPIMKNFTFSVYFNNPIFNNEEIVIKDKKIVINISTLDYETGIILYNSFNKQKNIKFSLNNNSCKLQNIELIKENNVLENEILIKFQSPLCVRFRKNEKDFYYSFRHQEFSEQLKINIREQLKISDLDEHLVDDFEIIPVMPKKVVLKFYEQQIECSTGTFKLKGDKNLLEFLYKSGMGSRHSAGFGMFQII